MALPNLNHAGELPEGVHQATINEVIAQFGSGTSQREIITTRLRQIYQLAKDTGNLQRFSHQQSTETFGASVFWIPAFRIKLSLSFYRKSPNVQKARVSVNRFIYGPA